MSLQADVRASRDAFAVEAAFSANAGETVALLGPNGAGKSTLVVALAGLLVPDAGRIALDGTILDDPAAGIHVPAEERSIGVVFQQLLLFPHLSALENVAFPLRATGADTSTARGRAGAALERLGVGARAKARPRDLSGGEAQRVALARALINEPRLLLLDEPLSALDVQARTEIRMLVRHTLAGFDGIRVLVTHDPVEAMTLADRMVIVEAGRVTQQGTPEDIRRAPRTPYAADLVGVNLFSGRLSRLPDGAGLLETAGGPVEVAWPDRADDPMSDVLGLLRPADVSLYRGRPDGSARNVLNGRIAGISLEGDRARVRIRSSPPLTAEVTSGSVTRLGLADGVEVWASFKAVEVTVVLP